MKPRYLTMIGVFGLLFFLVQKDGILCLAKEEDCTVWDALNLSVHTMSTIGFGTVVSNSRFTDALVMVEFWLSILMGAAGGGLLFSRVSTAGSRVAFSDVALVRSLKTVRGCPTISFRIVNERPFSCLFDVTCRVSALVRDSEAGLRVLASCKLERGSTMMFRAVWNLIHCLDEESPLFGLDETNCQEKFLALVVQLEGTDQTYMQKVFANKCYYPADFRFEEDFVDIMAMSGNRITVDLKGLSKTRRIKSPESEAVPASRAEDDGSSENEEEGHNFGV